MLFVRLFLGILVDLNFIFFLICSILVSSCLLFRACKYAHFIHFGMFMHLCHCVLICFVSLSKDIGIFIAPMEHICHYIGLACVMRINAMS